MFLIILEIYRTHSEQLNLKSFEWKFKRKRHYEYTEYVLGLVENCKNIIIIFECIIWYNIFLDKLKVSAIDILVHNRLITKSLAAYSGTF